MSHTHKHYSHTRNKNQLFWVFHDKRKSSCKCCWYYTQLQIARCLILMSLIMWYRTRLSERQGAHILVSPVYTFFAVSLLFPMAQQPLVGQGLLITEVSRSYSFRHTTLSRTPLDVWSARRRDLYLTTQYTHKRQTSMPPAGFETTIPTSEMP